MRPDLLDILACPLCKGPLTLDADDQAASESLRCKACGEVYPVADGIPNLLPPYLRGE